VSTGFTLTQAGRTRVFEVATDKEVYDPGETAALVLNGALPAGRALAVTEGRDGNRING